MAVGYEVMSPKLMPLRIWIRMYENETMPSSGYCFECNCNGLT